MNSTGSCGLVALPSAPVYASVKYTLGVLYIACSPVGSITNFIVLFSIMRVYDRTTDPSTYLISSLFFATTITALVAQPMNGAVILFYEKVGCPLKFATKLIGVWSSMCTIFNTMILIIHQSVRVLSMNMSSPGGASSGVRLRTLVPLVWVTSLVFSIVANCTGISPVVYFCFYTVFVLGVGLVVLVCSLLVIRLVVKQEIRMKKRYPSVSERGIGSTSLMKTLRLIRTMTILIGCLIVSYLPYVISGLLYATTKPFSQDTVFVGAFLVHLDSLVSPIVFGWRTNRVRHYVMNSWRHNNGAQQNTHVDDRGKAASKPNMSDAYPGSTPRTTDQSREPPTLPPGAYV